MAFADQVTIANGIQAAASTYSAAVSGKALVVAGACTLFGWDLYNPAANAAESFVQFFDAASTGAVTLGTTPPKLSKGLAPAGGGDTGSQAAGIAFANGIVVAATTTRAGSTAPANAIPTDLAYT